MSMFNVQSGPMRRSLVAFSTRTVADDEDDDNIAPTPQTLPKAIRKNTKSSNRKDQSFCPSRLVIAEIRWNPF
ncbi:hypothetical protein BHE74_00016335 [Ensete ventricosum]|uniref:Uncharacterized protein n=1 Tax=Ensete ventricosum TaxID=4639 RepID=A0A444FMM7_ENSVE|nr:hypothetical protein B296_00023161 [Ensete ventricosum]RWW23868.1 hypothetical protein GW17_00011864 [Ensete ventricosum]RWW75632.1 hypothetical protein BHE74_00016335 [Ensete ventricosum]RZS20199.1 hypothetical protein BHM03_00052692 [Ensete ventricosum]